LPDSTRASGIVRNLEAWYAAQADVPGMEVHRDPDITWMLSNGSTWANSGVSLRFSSANAGRRIDQSSNTTPSTDARQDSGSIKKRHLETSKSF
jgi:hypothetical protein